MKTVRNVAGSIRQRLLNKAHEEKRSFQEIAQSFLMERFLYRLSRSIHKEHFVLKGALLLRVWQAPEARTTMDVDLLGRMTNEETAVAATMREIVTVEVEPDGLSFLVDGISIERITEGAEYRGLRVQVPARLDTMRLYLQVDIGFGDKVYPSPCDMEYPTILDLPAPVVPCYSRESAIAEKLHAMLTHGHLNSRMKDFHDIWWLSRYFDFDGAVLHEAIVRTLSERGAVMPETIAAFSPRFVEMHRTQWLAFRKRIAPAETLEDLSQVVRSVDAFIGPLLEAWSRKRSFVMRWKAPGPWG